MLMCGLSLYIDYVVASTFLLYLWGFAAELLCSNMREDCLVTTWAFAAPELLQLVSELLVINSWFSFVC
jgi:hypothetical protein